MAAQHKQNSVVTQHDSISVFLPVNNHRSPPAHHTHPASNWLEVMITAGFKITKTRTKKHAEKICLRCLSLG